MKIIKRCLYRTNVINLLPSVMVTPLYSVVEGWRPKPMASYNLARAEWGGVQLDTPPDYWYVGGFRIAFKFIRLHAGIEVHYGS